MIAEVADLWFHCLVLLARHGLGPADVLRELARREGISGHAEKASRALNARATRFANERSAMANDSNCIFCKIVRGEIPSRKVYEDDDDAGVPRHPAASRPCISCSSRRSTSRRCTTRRPSDAPVLGRILTLAGRLAREQGADDGFRTIINTGRVGRQEVKHVHVHVIGGPDPLGPMIPRLRLCELSEATMGGLSIWHWLIVLWSSC